MSITLVEFARCLCPHTRVRTVYDSSIYEYRTVLELQSTVVSQFCLYVLFQKSTELDKLWEYRTLCTIKMRGKYRLGERKTPTTVPVNKARLLVESHCCVMSFCELLVGVVKKTKCSDIVRLCFFFASYHG